MGRPVDGMTVICDMADIGTSALWIPGKVRMSSDGTLIEIILTLKTFKKKPKSFHRSENEETRIP